MMYRKALALCLLLMSWPVLAQNELYLQELIQKSRDMHLAESDEWLNLLHFKPYPLWPGSRSLADDPSFFNAPNGKSNAAAELESTLKAFFSPIGETDMQQNPQCRFVARFQWLNQHLNFDAARMQVQECRRFNNWVKAINPYQITLVFPSAYLNSPGSMYGHTLLRIDAKDQDERTRLLAYTTGYSAYADDSNGLLFAFLGLTGGYHGVFQIQPYYIKVRDYSDMENRDIWEYRLNLTEDEIHRAVMHIWELGPTYFDYYFLDENCAYHLLSILEVARPSLKLTDEFRWWAIPSDTVRAVVRQPGLLREAIFRPSNATVIQQRLATLTPEERQLAKDLTDGKRRTDDTQMLQYTAAQQAQMLELSYDYLSYLRARNGDMPDASKRSHELLLARSRIDVPDATPKIRVPETRPDQGHNTTRVGLGWGLRDGQHYQEVVMRPSYHEQSDPGAGYTRGAQIQFFNLALRHYDDSSVRVEEFMPLDIYSLSPSNDYFHSISWKVNAGWSRKRFAADNEPLVTRLNGGAGQTWELVPPERGMAMVYAFVEATVEESDQYARHYALGMGPALGVMGNVAHNWRMSAYARVQRFAVGDVHTTTEMTLLQRFTIGAQSSMRVEMSRKQAFDLLWTDAQISWQQFF